MDPFNDDYLDSLLEDDLDPDFLDDDDYLDDNFDGGFDPFIG